MILFPRPGFNLVLDDPTRPFVLGGLGIGTYIGTEEEVERFIPSRRRKHADVSLAAMPYRVDAQTPGTSRVLLPTSRGSNPLDRIYDPYLTSRKKKPRCD